MTDHQPTYRFRTIKAMQEVAADFGLPFTTAMQDWPIKVSDPDHIELYLRHYQSQKDDNKKFVLMEMILQAVEDQAEHSLAQKYWNEVKPLLSKDFDLHQFTIYRWACISKPHLEGCFKISPPMADLWKLVMKRR